jgi:hypothetical protein
LFSTTGSGANPTLLASRDIATDDYLYLPFSVTAHTAVASNRVLSFHLEYGRRAGLGCPRLRRELVAIAHNSTQTADTISLDPMVGIRRVGRPPFAEQPC